MVVWAPKRRRAVWALGGVVALGLLACGGSHPAGSAAAAAEGSTSLSAAAPSGPAADWPTYHGQPARTGVATAGPPLGRAHRLWTAGVDGAVYAEPLVVGGKVIVATENNSVYAFDVASGHQAWRAHLGTPVPGGELPCGNIDPSGITGTPVVDRAAGVIYAVTFQRFEHRLVALDLATGGVRWQRRIDPPGADPRTHQQRAALALSRGRVYVSYGGLYGDCGYYHGWVLGAPASGPSGRVLSYRVPTGREGGIWAASGPAVDGAGNLYVATGNGSSPPGTGVPRCVRHASWPLATSKAYTELFSVATIALPPTTSGSAYTAPSTPAVHRRCTRPRGGPAAATPVREDCPW